MPQKCTETKNQQFGNFSTCSIICRPLLHFTLADCLSCVVVSVRCHQVSPGLQTINIWRLVRVHQSITGQMIQNTTIMNEHSYNKTNDFFYFQYIFVKNWLRTSGNLAQTFIDSKTFKPWIFFIAGRGGRGRRGEFEGNDGHCTVMN